MSFRSKATLAEHHTQPQFTDVRGLATSGPYRVTRNPIYVAATAVALGSGFMLNSMWFLAGLGVWLSVVRLHVIPQEEELLERLFGEEYRRYKATTPRFLLGLL